MDEVVTNPAIERDPRVLLVLSQAILDYIEGLVRASGGLCQEDAKRHAVREMG